MAVAPGGVSGGGRLQARRSSRPRRDHQPALMRPGLLPGGAQHTWRRCAMPGCRPSVGTLYARRIMAILITAGTRSRSDHSPTHTLAAHYATMEDGRVMRYPPILYPGIRDGWRRAGQVNLAYRRLMRGLSARTSMACRCTCRRRGDVEQTPARPWPGTDNPGAGNARQRGQSELNDLDLGATTGEQDVCRIAITRLLSTAFDAITEIGPFR